MTRKSIVASGEAKIKNKNQGGSRLCSDMKTIELVLLGLGSPISDTLDLKFSKVKVH